MTIVKRPTERHKSRLASREAGDGFTGTHGGGSWGRTRTVPKWPLERRARAGLMEAYGRDKHIHSWNLHPICIKCNWCFETKPLPKYSSKFLTERYEQYLHCYKLTPSTSKNLVCIVTWESVSTHFKYEMVLTWPTLFSDIPEKWRGRTLQSRWC